MSDPIVRAERLGRSEPPVNLDKRDQLAWWMDQAKDQLEEVPAALQRTRHGAARSAHTHTKREMCS